MTQNSDKKNPPPVYESPWYGRVSAVIWGREGKHGPMYSTELREHFKDADEAWKSTRSIGEDQLGNVAPATLDAQQWLARTRQFQMEERRRERQASNL